MARDDNELLQLRISSAPYAESGQLDAFIEVWGRKMLRFEIEPLGSHPLQIDAVLRSLPDFVWRADRDRRCAFGAPQNSSTTTIFS